MTKAAELAKMGEVLTNSQIGGRRNIIINGAMQISQRSTSETGIGDTNGVYPTLDRFAIGVGSSAGRFTMSQSTVTDLEGFTNALKIDVTTADTSIAAGEFLIIQHKIEGFNVQQLKATSTSTKPFTISFYAKSNESRALNLEARFSNGTNRQAVKTITTGTSWARYTMTVDAASNTQIDNDNSNEMQLNFWLHAGSTYTGGTPSTTLGPSTNNQRAAGVGSIYASTDNTLEITGIQLEVGEQATPFEHRSFGEELALCQRYYEKKVAGASYHMFGIGRAVAANRVDYKIDFVVSKRAEGATASFSNLYSYSSAANAEVSTLSTSYFGKEGGLLSCVLNTSSMSVNVYAALLSNNDPAAFLAFDSEL